jgi:hypothetical protein
VAEELWDGGAVARFLGVAPVTVRAYLHRRRQTGFPEPDYVISGAPAWRPERIRSLG